DLVSLLRNEMKMLDGNSCTRMLLKEALPFNSLGTAQQRNRSSGDVRAHPLPDFHVVFGKVAFGDACIIPIHAVGMSKADARYTVVYGRCATFHGRCTAGRGDCAFAYNLFRRLVLAHSLKRRLPHPLAAFP